MRIGVCRIENRENKDFLISTIKDEILKKEIDVFFSVGKEYGKYIVNECLDSFLLSCLWPAVVSGQDIYVEGAISDYAFKHYPTLVHLMCKAHNCEPIKIFADNIVQLNFEPTAVAAAFSGGVDSLATYLMHSTDDCPERFRLTHLTLFNVGAYGSSYNSASREFAMDISRAEVFAQEVGLPLLIVDSNIGELFDDYPDGHNHSGRLMCVISASVLALQKLFKIYYVASSVTVDNTQLRKRQQDYYESLISQLLSNNNTSIFITEPTLNRTEKTELLLKYPITQKHLCVCCAGIINNTYDLGFDRNGYINCGECRKCMRTLLTIDALGQLNDYSFCFDIEKYTKMRDKMLVDIFENNSDVAFVDELYELLLIKGQLPEKYIRYEE